MEKTNNQRKCKIICMTPTELLLNIVTFDEAVYVDFDVELSIHLRMLDEQCWFHCIEDNKVHVDRVPNFRQSNEFYRLISFYTNE